MRTGNETPHFVSFRGYDIAHVAGKGSKWATVKEGGVSLN
jgi:hypothetical protein